MGKGHNRNVFYLLSVAAGLGAGGLALWLAPDYALLAAALGLFGSYLAHVLWQLPKLTPDYLRTHARQADLPVTAMFVVALVAVATSVISLFQLINEKHDPNITALVLALVDVALAWGTIHTMYAIHYAHACWLDDDVTDARQDATPRSSATGLKFPGDDEPGGYDFLYFSFVIGLTAQTADVDTTTTALRRIVLRHSILAYFFNAVIVAAAVNLAVNLGG